MERKKQYNEKQVEQDLYQYEMGIELGADVEAEKQQHLNEYQRENKAQDGNFERSNRQNQQQNQGHSLNSQNQNKQQNNSYQQNQHNHFR